MPGPIPLRLTTVSEKKTRTTVDTILVTPKILATWKSPPFQRPVTENEKVLALAEQMKADGGVWPGVVTLGRLGGETYLVDGQHRGRAFKLSGLEEGYVDVRILHVEDMAEMGEEFVRLNSQLVRMRPDDILRGLEHSVDALSKIRRACPFVGYDMIRRSEKSPVLSMSSVIRGWRSSSTEIPSPGGGVSAAMMARCLMEQDVRDLTDFLKDAMEAWGRDAEYLRLWGSLNMTMCMWIYRRMVLTQYSPATPRLSREQFKKCLMSLSADQKYLDWLVGRLLTERDRSPCYSRIRLMFLTRLQTDTGKRLKFPQPAWFSGA